MANELWSSPLGLVMEPDAAAPRGVQSSKPLWSKRRETVTALVLSCGWLPKRSWAAVQSVQCREMSAGCRKDLSEITPEVCLPC